MVTHSTFGAAAKKAWSPNVKKRDEKPLITIIKIAKTTFPLCTILLMLNVLWQRFGGN